MSEMRVAFTLTSLSPILFHADDVEAADTLDEWRKAPENKNVSKAGDDRSPAWTWQTYLYSDGEYLAWPSINLMVGLRTAGAQMILKKQKTFKEITQSGLLIPGEHLQFLVNGKRIPMSAIEDLREETFPSQAAAVKELGFKLFVKRARVGQSKHVRVRARFEKWVMRGVIEVLLPEITYEALEQLFELAGRGGQGDWRVACRTPGPYGQFASTLKRVADEWEWPAKG